jgi:hypothetical protein
VLTLPAGLLMLAHRGNKVYSADFDLFRRREASKPNGIWQVDHAQLNIKLLRDDGSIAKPRLTIVIDDYSRAVAGCYFGLEAFTAANHLYFTSGHLAQRRPALADLWDPGCPVHRQRIRLSFKRF